jgi:hypothetical protein
MRLQNPNNATTGTPQYPAMCVNSVDSHGHAADCIARDQWGRLMLLDKKGKMYPVDEGRFYRWLVALK